jgi:hypothetical protein
VGDREADLLARWHGLFGAEEDSALQLEKAVRSTEDPNALDHRIEDFESAYVGSGVRLKKHRKTYEVWMTGPGDDGVWYRIKSTGREGVVFEAFLRGGRHLSQRVTELERQLAMKTTDQMNHELEKMVLEEEETDG